MIDWKNWKTGAKIGLLYGFAGLVYFLFFFWALNPPTPLGQPICDGCNNWALGFIIIGLVLFSPIFCLDIITSWLLGPFLFPNSIILLMMITMPFYGALFGAAVGHLFNRLDKT